MKTVEEKSYGVVPVFKTNKIFLFCLVRQHQGHWSFPKGHGDEGESEEETALRELKEETGILDVNFLNGKSFIERYTFEREGIMHDKSVKYFLGLIASMVTTTPKNFKNEIPEMKWVTYEEANRLLTFPEAKRVLDQAFEYLK